MACPVADSGGEYTEAGAESALLQTLHEQLDLQRQSVRLQEKLIEILTLERQPTVALATKEHIGPIYNIATRLAIQAQGDNCQATQVSAEVGPCSSSQACRNEATTSSPIPSPVDNDDHPTTPKNMPVPEKHSWTSIISLYIRFFLAGDFIKCFTEHKEWNRITIEAMDAPRLREMIIALLETLMVFYTLMLTVAIAIVQELADVSETVDLVIAFVSYVLVASSFMATTIVFCFLKMVLAVADCNLKLWLKANSHVFFVLNNSHNMITLSSFPLFGVLSSRAVLGESSEAAFPASVRVAYIVLILMLSAFVTVIIGLTLCAPARSAAHTGSMSGVPVSSPSVVMNSTKWEAQRVLFDTAFNPNVMELIDFYRSLNEKADDGETAGIETLVNEPRTSRSGGMIPRKRKP